MLFVFLIICLVIHSGRGRFKVLFMQLKKARHGLQKRGLKSSENMFRKKPMTGTISLQVMHIGISDLMFLYLVLVGR